MWGLNADRYKEVAYIGDLTLHYIVIIYLLKGGLMRPLEFAFTPPGIITNFQTF